MEKENRQQYIIFDINSSSIGVLVFDYFFDKKKKKNVYSEIFTDREYIIHKQESSVTLFFDKTLKTLQSLSEKSQLFVNGNLADVYINVSAPWSSSQKRILHYEKEKEFIFNEQVEKEIIEKELSEALHHTRDFREFKDLDIIERKTLAYFENGYITKKPYGKKVKDVDIHSLVGVISKKTKKAFSHVIEKTFHREAKFFSNVFMLHTSLQQIIDDKKEVLTIDISGELSEIFIHSGGEIKKIGVIPVGAYHITRELSRLLDIPFVKAKSLIEMYQEEHLHSAYKKKIEKAMRKAFISWFKHFYNFLNDISKEHIIPDTIAILSPVYMKEWFNESLMVTEELGEHMHANKDISILDFHSLWRVSKKTELAHIEDDNLAMCLAYFEAVNEMN
jgi:hypothetical protein